MNTLLNGAFGGGSRIDLRAAYANSKGALFASTAEPGVSVDFGAHAAP